MIKDADSLKDLINKQYSIYSNPQSTDAQKGDARNEIITKFYEDEVKKNRKKPDIVEHAGISIMSALEKSLNSYSSEKGTESGFFGYLYKIYKTEINAHLIEESMNYRAGKEFTPHAIKTYRKIQKEY